MEQVAVVLANNHQYRMLSNVKYDLMLAVPALVIASILGMFVLSVHA